jgi:eukaryotic-like serine/threonine-protein kinase
MIRTETQLRAFGDLARAEDLTEKIEAVAERFEADPTVFAYLCSMRASRALYDQDFGQFLVLTTSVVEAFEEAGDVRRSCTACVNAGYAAARLGLYELAEELLTEALADAERLDLGMVRTTAMHHLGRVLGLLDRHDEALSIERQALAAALVQGDRRMAGTCRIYLAEILCVMGDHAAAEAEAERAIEDLLHVPPLLPYAHALLAETLLASGRPAEARVVATEGMRWLEKIGQVEDGEALLRIVYVESLVATGELALARLALDIARNRLLTRAGHLREANTRAAFLGKVPEHERTLELARAWAEQAAAI